MKRYLLFTLTFLGWTGLIHLHADTHYVSHSGSHTFPYTSWATAANNIQAAVNAASVNDTVLVNDGIYDTGGAPIPAYTSTNRVMISKDITVESVNGPDFTFIVGEGPLGDTAVRGVYMSVGILSGFTITNGHTKANGSDYDGAGGGINLRGGSGQVTNCIITGNTAYRYGGGCAYGTLYDCTLKENYAYSGGGGGSAYSVLNNCLIKENITSTYGTGGGTYEGELNFCVLVDNISTNEGGGSARGTLNNCTLIGNSAPYSRGGGSTYSDLNNCTVKGNYARDGGGACRGGTLRNSLVTENSSLNGGGTFAVYAYNSTIYNNIATGDGGGCYSGRLYNSIVWGNSADGSGNDSYAVTSYNSCSPELEHGVDGNITNNPLLLSTWRIAVDSPCNGGGNNIYASGLDYEDEAWLTPPSIGCDEVHPGGITGSISVAIIPLTTNLIVSGVTHTLQGGISGNVSRVVWNMGDGISISNLLSVTHSWLTPGTNEVILTAYNQTFPGGVSETQTIYAVSALDHAVHVAPSGDDGNDGSSFALAKKTIQAGVDAQLMDGGMVLLHTGSYNLTNEVYVGKRLQILGNSGPETTIVDGGGVSRCFHLGVGDIHLSGLTITGGYSPANGGGILCTNTDSVVTNCYIIGNTANNGGGMHMGEALHCTVADNTALNDGGGLSESIARHCSIRGNTAADLGGGLYDSTADNCEIIQNSAEDSGGGMHEGTASHCFISENTTQLYGGGMRGGTAEYCTIIGNKASSQGGGFYDSSVHGCVILNNTATSGGGANRGTINNSTIIYNSATSRGGGIYSVTAGNCIVWDNSSDSDPNIYSGSVFFSCSPDVTHSVNGNITNAPQLVSASHITTNSPCRGAGDAAYSSGTDLDGEVWLNPPSIGCDEVHGSVTGAITMALSGPVGIVPDLVGVYFANIEGPVTGSLLDFGDGTIVTNPTLAAHSWSVTGIYNVTLTAFNDDNPSGVVITQQVEVVTAAASTIHVSDLTGDDTNDGQSWGSAKKSIQAGIDAQLVLGGTVLISNGTYAVSSGITISKTLLVQSLAGPDVTIVHGGESNRCFNLGAYECIISGLTITNGYSSLFGGGIVCDSTTPVITNCVITGCSAYYGGGVQLGTVLDSIIHDNTAEFGGGLYQSEVYDCFISGNSAQYGGGLSHCIVSNSILDANNASQDGGGSSDSELTDCIVTGNFASRYGGGLHYGSADKCTLVENIASSGGGGAYLVAISNSFILANQAHNGGGIRSGWAYNCAIAGNEANSGGGSYHTTVHHCTITGNAAAESAGGINAGGGAQIYNSIIWGNEADMDADFHNPNPWPVLIRNTCSKDVPHGVDGNITNNPLLVSSSSIHTNSPCRGTGDITYTYGQDLHGDAWLDPPSMGCDEVALPVAGSVILGLYGPEPKVITDLEMSFIPFVSGPVTATYLSFGDGTVITNPIATYHAWQIPGNYNVILTAFNEGLPGGISYTQQIEVVSLTGSVIYVSTDTGNDANDGVSWATAKQSLQAGVDAQIVYGGLVSVSNGTYLLSEEVVVDKYLTLKGLGGPADVIVDGGGSDRCFTLNHPECSLESLTITNGYKYIDFNQGSGGGVSCNFGTSSVTNCIITGNFAVFGGGMAGGLAENCVISHNIAERNGGGVYFSVAENCSIVNNSATNFGGGVYRSGAGNCMIIGNTASYNGGGAMNSWLLNCTVVSNSAGSYNGGVGKDTTIYRTHNSIVWNNVASYEPDIRLIPGTCFNSCSPDLTHGVDGNITNSPLFTDMLSGDYHLTSNSPCVNWGNNAEVIRPVDLDLNNRIVEGYVDIGCYEYQGLIGDSDNDLDGISDAWERLWFGMNIHPDENADMDPFSNGEEYVAGTDPTNASSYFTVTSGMADSTNTTPYMVIQWDSVIGRVYNVMWTPSLSETFDPLETGIQYPQNSYTDMVHGAEASGFYRVVVMRSDYDMDGDCLPNAWEAQYGVTDPYADDDGDGADSLSEFIAGTDPTNSASYFSAAHSLVDVSGTNCFVVEWASIPDRTYSVWWSTSLTNGLVLLATDIEFPQNSYTDTTHNAESAAFYGIEVEK